MSLCLTCGLCCDGTLFQVVPVTPAEAARLEGRVTLSDDRSKLLQGCRALDGCACGVYADRPTTCRVFKCLVLAQLDEGKLSEADAHAAIEDVLGRRARVAALLGEADVRTAMERAREQVSAGAASDELTGALRRLAQAVLFMQLQPQDSALRDFKKS